MTHFTDAEIRRWSASGPGADRERVVTHVGTCASCAAIYAEAVRAHAMSPEHARVDDVHDADEFVRVGYDVPAKRGTVVPFPVRRRTIVSLAAAAALIAALALPYVVQRREPPRQITRRGAGVHALSPSGSVAAGSAFAWSSDVAATKYVITIGDATGVLHVDSVAGTRAELPASAWSKLTAGVDYWWTATAIDRSGHVLAVSSPEAFTIRPR